jgi:hypothetical protein
MKKEQKKVRMALNNKIPLHAQTCKEILKEIELNEKNEPKPSSNDYYRKMSKRMKIWIESCA